MRTGPNVYSEGAQQILEAKLSSAIRDPQEFALLQDALRHPIGTTITLASDACEAVQICAEEVVSALCSRYYQANIAYSSNLPIPPVRQLHRNSEYQELCRDVFERRIAFPIPQNLVRAEAMYRILLERRTAVTMTIHEASLRQHAENGREDDRHRKMICRQIENLVMLLLAASENVLWGVDENEVHEQAYYELPNGRKLLVTPRTASTPSSISEARIGSISTGGEAREGGEMMQRHNGHLRERDRGNDYLMSLISEIRQKISTDN